MISRRTVYPKNRYVNGKIQIEPDYTEGRTVGDSWTVYGPGAVP